ncbi:MAG TPA: HdeD family acid-resistance protein [Ktedonobacterales bacterium]|nr:HdeD family acid-resistance protein [Ktedonobacterales bacterium]
MATWLARDWWAIGLRGVVAIIFGVLTLVEPRITLLIFIAFFAAYAIIDGLLAIYMSIRGREQLHGWGWLLVEGIAGVLLGILALRWPQVTTLVLLAFIAAWAIITGIGEIFEAIELRKTINNEWLLILSGAVSVLFGLILIIFPASGIMALLVVVGAYAIIFGILLLGLAWRLRGIQTKQLKGDAAPTA